MRTHQFRFTTLIAFVALYNGVLVPRANGFASFCFDVHRDITNAVLTSLNINASPCAVAKVVAANRGQDSAEGQGSLGTSLACPTVFAVGTKMLTYYLGPSYKPVHHFDRIPVTSSVDAALAANLNDFIQSRAYLISEWHNVQSYAAAGHNDDALAALGRALHVLQDFFAHSNYVDLKYGLAGQSGDDAKALSALFDMTGTLQPPAALLFTSYGGDPKLDLEQPPDILNYTHGTYAKDWTFPGLPLKNREATIVVAPGTNKFDAAKSAAYDASYQFIYSIPGVNKILYVTNCNAKSHPGQIIESGDPNDKSGPQGVGSGQWVSSQSPVPYAIFYTNEAAASAPAQKVTITDVLDGNIFDLNTVQLGLIGVPAAVVTPPSLPLAQNSFSTTIDLRPSQNVLLKITASLNSATGTATWVLQSLDPATGQPPTNPLVGFLPPGASGSVVLNVRVKPTLATGSLLKNQATIIFDANAPIATQQWVNALDVTIPASKIAVLPGASNATTFNVNWSGTDSGVGTQDYTVYVSDNGGPFVAWLSNTNQVSSVYAGSTGHSYGFYSIARDFVGNVEAPKTAADAVTSIPLAPNCAADHSSGVLVTQGGYRYNNGTKQFSQTVSLMNVSGTAIVGPVSLVIDRLSTNAAVAGNSGFTVCAAPANSPYVNLNLGTSGILANGQTISLTLQFNDPSLGSITYSPRLLGGPQGR